MGNEDLTIKELAEQLGVHFNTLRQWEKELEIVVPRSKDSQRSRYYTKKEIDIFTKVRDLRRENVSMDNIRKYLNRDISAIEQEEMALAALPISEISAAEIQNLLADIIIKREKELKEEFKEELQEELNKQESRIIEELTQNHLEQIKAENNRLIKYIEETREQPEKKSILSWFKK